MNDPFGGLSSSLHSNLVPRSEIRKRALLEADEQCQSKLQKSEVAASALLLVRPCDNSPLLGQYQFCDNRYLVLKAVMDETATEPLGSLDEHMYRGPLWHWIMCFLDNFVPSRVWEETRLHPSPGSNRSAYVGRWNGRRLGGPSYLQDAVLNSYVPMRPLGGRMLHIVLPT